MLAARTMASDLAHRIPGRDNGRARLFNGQGRRRAHRGGRDRSWRGLLCGRQNALPNCRARNLIGRLACGRSILADRNLRPPASGAAGKAQRRRGQAEIQLKAGWKVIKAAPKCYDNALARRPAECLLYNSSNNAIKLLLLVSLPIVQNRAPVSRAGPGSSRAGRSSAQSCWLAGWCAQPARAAGLTIPRQQVEGVISRVYLVAHRCASGRLSLGAGASARRQDRAFVRAVD